MSMHFCVQFATLYNSHIMFISLTFFNYVSCPLQSNYYMWSYTIPQVVSHQLNTMKVQVQFHDGLHGICGGQSGNGAGFFHSASVFLCQLWVLCTHLSSGVGTICHIITPHVTAFCTIHTMNRLPAHPYLKHLQYRTRDFQHPIQWRDKIIFNYKYVITEL